jgi:hypothetical protein
MVQLIAVQTFDGEAPQVLHLSHNICCVASEKNVRRILTTEILLGRTFAAHEMSRHNRSGSSVALLLPLLLPPLLSQDEPRIWAIFLLQKVGSEFQFKTRRGQAV